MKTEFKVRCHVLCSNMYITPKQQPPSAHAEQFTHCASVKIVFELKSANVDSDAVSQPCNHLLSAMTGFEHKHNTKSVAITHILPTVQP